MCAIYIGFDKNIWLFYGIIYMRLSRKMNYASYIKLFKNVFNQLSVANIAFYKFIAWMVFNLFEILQIASISEFIQIDNSVIWVFFKK